MTLGDGSHVKIGPYYYMLDEAVDSGSKSMALYRPHYKYSNESLFKGSGAQDVTGSPGKQQLRPERLIWYMDDWAGGENGRIFYADDPTTYNWSTGLNPRVKGTLQSRPARTYWNAESTTNDATKPIILRVAAGTVWRAQGRRIAFLGDPTSTTWNLVNSTASAGTDYTGLESLTSGTHVITALAGDNTYLYYAAWHSGVSGTRVILAKTADTNTTLAYTLISEQTGQPPWAGMCVMNQRLYAWSGVTLIECDIFGGFPLSPAPVHEVQTVTISKFTSGDSFKLTKNGIDSGTFVWGGNGTLMATAANMKTNLITVFKDTADAVLDTGITVTGGRLWNAAGTAVTQNLPYVITFSTYENESVTATGKITATAVAGTITSKIDVTTQGVASTSGATGTVRTIIGNTGQEMPSSKALGTDYWADCVATENSVFAFMTTAGQSVLYEYRSDTKAFAPVWTAPMGYMIRSIRYNNGKLYVGGQWGTDGHGALFGMSLQDRQMRPLANVRRQNSVALAMDVMCPTYDDSVLVGDSATGRIFQYDTTADCLSMFDDLSTELLTEGSPTTTRPAKTDALVYTVANARRIGSMLTMGARRFVGIYGGSVTESMTYVNDEPANRQAGTGTNTYSASLESGLWDFELPFDKKTLMGYDVTFDATTIPVGASILVEYSIDGAAWATAGTVTSASTGATQGRCYIQVSTGTPLGTTVPFSLLKTRVTLSGTSGVKPPVLWGVAAEATIIQYEETWDLIVRIKDSQAGTRAGRSGTMQTGAAKARFLRTAAANKQVVTFLDGYMYPLNKEAANTGQGDQAGYDVHTVTVENPELILVKKGEGDMMLTLRAIPS